MRSALTFFLLFFIAALSTLQAEGLPCHLRLTFLDVGEGDSLIIEQQNFKPLVLDSGNPFGGAKAISYIQSRKVSELEAIIITHTHLDHIGGVFGILRSFPVMKRFDNGQSVREEANANDLYRWYDEFFRQVGEYSQLRKGDVLRFGGVKLSVLWPPAGTLSPDWNHNSLVLALSFGSFRALLMGDALDSTEQALLQEKLDLNAHILKVGHHGSKHASSESFLTHVRPKAMIVSVNSNNIRGYPAKETMKRLALSGHVARTDLDGDIIICAEENGRFDVTTEKPRGK